MTTLTQPSTFETLLSALDGAEAHRTLFEKAYRASPEGFASVVASALRYSPRKSTTHAFAAVLAGEHLTKGHATTSEFAGWVVHVESDNGVKPHRFADSAAAAAFVKGLGEVGWISDADPITREIYVEKRASQASESRAPAHEAAA